MGRAPSKLNVQEPRIRGILQIEPRLCALGVTKSRRTGGFLAKTIGSASPFTGSIRYDCGETDLAGEDLSFFPFPGVRSLCWSSRSRLKSG